LLTSDQVESLVNTFGFTDFKWIDPHEIIVAEWVRMKCKFGCDSYGRMATCPPNTPPVDECQRFFSDYQHGIILHFPMVAPEREKRKACNTRINLKLLKLENTVFMAGYPKALVFFMAPCTLCAECVPKRVDCKKPAKCRPTPEGMAVDVFSTVSKLGYPIEVLTDKFQAVNRYAMLMID
jgi:predicted metal-binding protein